MVLGRLLVSILRIFSHTFGNNFPTSFLTVFFRIWVSIWEVFGGNLSYLFGLNWFQNASRSEKLDFHETIVIPS